MNRFHPKLHDLALQKLQDLNVEVILNERIPLPKGDPSIDHRTTITLSSGKAFTTDLVV
jgi:hypothetical protein